MNNFQPSFLTNAQEIMALEFAAVAHEGQLRKYTQEPYIVHPISVAHLVSTVEHTSDMICAALLHDVVEDTPVTIDQIETTFGSSIAELVGWLTDVSVPEDGNRATRKALDREHLSRAPAEAQTVKVADMIDNTSSISQYDSDFWQVYRLEKIELLKVLPLANKALLAQAWINVTED